jgi:uncharacterized damage-inducible protein DinB
MPAVKEFVQRAESAVNKLVKGVVNVPEEKRGWKLADTSRSALDILNHASYWTLFMGRTLAGESLPASEEEWLSATPELKDPEGARELAERIGREFVAVVQALSSQDLEREVEMPWGQQTVAQVILDNYWHLSYHEGQLNYIQTLLGDTEDHD